MLYMFGRKPKPCQISHCYHRTVGRKAVFKSDGCQKPWYEQRAEDICCKCGDKQDRGPLFGGLGD